MGFFFSFKATTRKLASNGIVFAWGLRQCDPGPPQDERGGMEWHKGMCCEILDTITIIFAFFPTVSGSRDYCRVSSVFALGSLYITPNIAEDIRSHRQPLLRNHLSPCSTSRNFLKWKFVGWFESQLRTINCSLASVWLISHLKCSRPQLESQRTEKSPQSTSYTHTHMHA